MYLWAEVNYLVIGIFYTYWGLAIVVDHERDTFHLGRILIYFIVDLALRSFKCDALVAYVVIVTVKGWGISVSH